MTVASVGVPNPSLGFSLGGIIRTIGGAVVGGLTGGVGGAIAGGIAGATGGGFAPSTTPNGNGARGACPPGTACSGPSVSGPFGSGICVGTCRPVGTTVPSGGALNPCPEGFELRDVAGQIICQPIGSDPFTPAGTGGGGTAVTPVQTTNGVCSTGGCVTPGGQKGRLRCVTRRGQRFTTCVATRRINHMNPKAARKAVTRLNGAVRELRKIEGLVKGIPIAKPRRAPARKSKCGC